MATASALSALSMLAVRSLGLTLVSLHFPPGTIRSCQRAIIKYNRRMLTSLGKEVPVTVEVEKDLSGSESIDEDDASDSGGEGEETEPIERKPEVPSLHCVRALTCLSSRWATLLPCRYKADVLRLDACIYGGTLGVMNVRV